MAEPEEIALESTHRLIRMLVNDIYSLHFFSSVARVEKMTRMHLRRFHCNHVSMHACNHPSKLHDFHIYPLYFLMRYCHFPVLGKTVKPDDET
jgi:hypothetical protein